MLLKFRIHLEENLYSHFFFACNDLRLRHFDKKNVETKPFIETVSIEPFIEKDSKISLPLIKMCYNYGTLNMVRTNPKLRLQQFQPVCVSLHNDGINVLCSVIPLGSLINPIYNYFIASHHYHSLWRAL